MKYNKLIPDHFREIYKNDPSFGEHRCTGQTLGECFQLIGECLKNPNKLIRIKFSNQHNFYTRNMINVIIQKQELKFIEIKPNGIYYNLFGER